jgi:hypothetical protein
MSDSERPSRSGHVAVAVAVKVHVKVHDDDHDYVNDGDFRGETATFPRLLPA